MAKFTDLPVELHPLIFNYENFRSFLRSNTSYHDKPLMGRNFSRPILDGLALMHSCIGFQRYGMEIIQESLLEFEEFGSLFFWTITGIRCGRTQNFIKCGPREIQLHINTWLKGLGTFYDGKFVRQN